MGCPEERFSRRGSPVDQEPATRAVREAKPSDVHGVGVGCADHAPEAEVQTEAAQGAQASGQPVDLHVAVQRLLAYAAWRLALGIKAVGQVGDRLFEALRDGREMLLIARDQRRVGLGGQAVGKVKSAGNQGIDVISSDLTSRATSARSKGPPWRVPGPRPATLRHDPGLAASPPVGYKLIVEGCLKHSLVPRHPRHPGIPGVPAIPI